MATRRPAEAFPPGDFLREELDERGWSQADLAEILGRTRGMVNEIVTGKRAITPDTALGLAAALGTSPELWLNLEAGYQLSRVRTDKGDAISRRAQLYAKAPVREMVRRGWIEPSESIDVLEHRVLDFLEIGRLDEDVRLAHAARETAPGTTRSATQTAWLKRAQHLARAVLVRKYAASNLEATLPQIRALASAPQESRHVPRVLSEAGVRLVIVQALPAGRIDGAAFWLDEGSPVIALSLRWDRLDNFWFTLLHELGHVLKGEMAVDTVLDGFDDSAGKPEEERAADRFASELLIPASQLDDFIARVHPLYSTRRIEGFAQTMGVHPAIVVGQLQSRKEIAWASFRPLLVPVREWITSTTVTDGWGSALPPGL